MHFKIKKQKQKERIEIKRAGTAKESEYWKE